MVLFFYQISFLKEVKCAQLCPPKVYKKGDKDALKKLKFLKRGIMKNYQHHW